MQRVYTDTELKERLRGMTVICDTREQKNSHVTAYLNSKGVNNISRKLDIGDYAVQLEDISFEKDFVVERKADLDEICGNLTADRQRFEREFTRAKANGTKVFLVIENATWSDIFQHNYKSKMSEASLIASLFTWQVRFNITVVFSPHLHTGEIILGLLQYATREYLLSSTV